MENLKLDNRYKKIIQEFLEKLQDIYQDQLLSVTLYGSAVNGEFADKSSNLNLLVVLKSTDLQEIKKSTMLVSKFKMISALFLTQEYIESSLDIFPIEFLDMKDNYFLVYGNDILKDIQIDQRNLRFQCEHELKAKLIKLKQAYLISSNKILMLSGLLFLTFSSSLYILRNVLRLKGQTVAYLKSDVIKFLAQEFKIDSLLWEKVLAAKNKQIKLSKKEVEELFVGFVKDLELIVNIVDKL